MTNTIIRLVTSTEDSVFDSKKRNNGNPIFGIFRPNTAVYNGNDYFYNLNIPSIFLEKGNLELEIESSNITASINFVNALNNFYITLIILDKDNEETNDINLAPPIDMKHYNINNPIQQY